MQKISMILLFALVLNGLEVVAIGDNTQTKPILIEQGKRCHLCRLSIHGKYWAYENGVGVCLRCEKIYKKCSGCGIPTKRGVREGRSFYCHDCLAKVPRCNYCRGKIFDDYVKLGKKNACKNCLERLPKCDRCGDLMKQYHRSGQRMVCIPCSRQLPQCARCRSPLLKNYYEFPGDPRKFCPDCAKDDRRCDICSKPLTIRYRELPDSRKICTRCIATAVQDTATVREILDKVLYYLRMELNMNIRMPTKLHLVDADTLASLRTKHIHAGYGNRRALGLFLRNNDRIDIYIESMLPYSLCMAVIAHEYAHAWQSENFAKGVSLLWLEGFAEWISYKSLHYYGYRNQAELIPLQKDVYGEGFRKVLLVEKLYGTRQVVSKVVLLSKPD